MLNRSKSHKQDSFATNRKKEDEAQSNRDRALKARLAHLEAVRQAQKSADKKPSK